MLGPLAVWVDGRELALAVRSSVRCWLCCSCRPNELVPTARLVEELWGEVPPATSVKAVQGYVSRLRKVLGEGGVETRPGGYVLRVEEGALDVQRFEGSAGAGSAVAC